MSKTKLTALRGMNDLLPADAALWEAFEAQVFEWLTAYGYRQIRTPILEATDLFVKGIGEVTDVVEHEMYSFEDKLNGERMTLRPEFTAGVMRAAIEHNLTYDAPRRLWSTGPLFRHERPQRGRYRQFHQVNVEALGFEGPDIDAEHIVMLSRLWRTLQLGPVRLEINCLGHADERARHRADLVAYFERHAAALDADARRRLHANPLRILDTKNPALQEIVAGAPRITDYLGDASRKFFDDLQTLLGAAKIEFAVNPRLVRGLDYYNLTVFEWITDALGSQGTICGGGRYDPLAERLGGKPTPSCGYAIGVERVIDLLRERSTSSEVVANTDVYVVHQGGATAHAAFVVAEQLRDGGLDVIYHAGTASLKSQMKRADASGAAFAVIVGESELQQGAAAVKSLHPAHDEAPFARQSTVPQTQLAQALVAACLYRNDNTQG
jgi:histidyl-tRNA synthetase